MSNSRRRSRKTLPRPTPSCRRTWTLKVRWKCHLCEAIYITSVTKRCLIDGHRNCATCLGEFEEIHELDKRFRDRFAPLTKDLKELPNDRWFGLPDISECPDQDTDIWYSDTYIPKYYGPDYPPGPAPQVRTLCFFSFPSASGSLKKVVKLTRCSIYSNFNLNPSLTLTLTLTLNLNRNIHFRQKKTLLIHESVRIQTKIIMRIVVLHGNY